MEINQSGWVSQITGITDSTGQGRVFGIGADGQVYTKSELSNDTWTGWQSLPSLGSNVTTTKPLVVNGATSIIALKAASIVATNDAQGWRVFAIVNGNAFTLGARDTGWTNLGGDCLQLATGTNSSTGYLELFAIGTDHYIYEEAAHGAGTAGFSGVTFKLITPSTGPTTLAPNFAVANQTTSVVATPSFNAPVQSIAVARNNDGREELFGIGATDHAVWTIEQTTANGAWGSWQNLYGWVSQIAFPRC